MSTPIRRRKSGIWISGAGKGAVTIISDSFNRADNPAGIGVADTGQTWVNRQGVYGVIGGAAYIATDATPNSNIATIPAGVSNLTAQVRLAASMNSMGVIIRFTDVNNFIAFRRANGTTFDLFKMVANVFTQLGSALATPNNNDVLAIVGSGSSLTGILNGVPIITGINDAFNISATDVGLFDPAGISGGERWEDFKVTVP